MNFLKGVKKIYEFLFWMLIPFIVMMLPTVPAVLFNEWYALLMFVSFPFGVALFSYSVEKLMNI